MQVDERCFRASVIWLVVTLILISIAPMAIAVESGTGLAYVYSADTTSAKYYISLLEGSGYQADMVPLGKIADSDLSKYNVIIIGPDTTWSDITSVDDIKNSNRPLIGLGEGGYELFGQLGLGSGYPNGWHGSENSIYVVDASHAIFQKPNSINIPEDAILQLYDSSGHVGIYIPSVSTGITMLGRETGNIEHYPLLLEDNKYLFWSFTASPESMTDTGKILFINILAYMSGIDTGSEELERIETPVMVDLPVVVRPELMRIEVIREPIVFATPVETVEKRIGDSFDLGDGYILLISEVNANGEVRVQVEQDGELIEEKVLVKDQNYLLPKATGENLSISIGDIHVGAVPTDVQVMMLVVPYLLLTVVSQPGGAEIFIDDEIIDSTPKEDIVLTDFDEHNLRLELEGYRTYEETIRFTRGGEAEIEKSIQLTSSMMEEQTFKQPEEMKATSETEEERETEEVIEKKEIEDTATSEEEKLQAEKEQTEQESSSSVEGESESVPGFLLITAFASLICGYGLTKWKKE
ncbi:PEGA domain-containing protein [Methanomethylovorans sp.]|uniref:PEGA domain-containing protein n=1 Tax=Methanomethylovorans sp. TaxID=2758717 RepID=UPI00351C4D8F